MPRRWSRVALVAALLGAGGCIPIATPPMPEDIASALAAKPMRRLETPDMVLYYPEQRAVEAQRFLTRVEGCVAHLRRAAHVHNGVADEKVVAILPDLPFNNAFSTPRFLGYPPQAVVPIYDTADVFALEFGLPPDLATIGCHELTHFVHGQQIAGFAWFWNVLFGDIYTPQIGLDPWFAEGLAVYYETKLQPGTGRLAWPFWRGSFAAAYAGRRINGGDLSVFQRDYHAGNHYLVGSQFVRFLADRYGDDKLWKLIHVQARSIFFPLWVNVRFWQAYDKSLSTLLDEFADEVRARMPPRARPPGQRVVRAIGYSARYARAADGSEAIISEDHDLPPRLTVFGPDGRMRADHDLIDVVPPRRLIVASPSLASGLSFSPDGRSLYFMAVDVGVTYQVARLMRYDLDAGTLTVVARDLQGTGGSISPDGRRYAFARADGDHHDLAEIDLASGAVRVLGHEAHGAFLALPRFSPDGKRLVAMRFDGRQFRVVVLDATDGRTIRTLPTAEDPVHDASWADDHRVVYLRGTAADVGFQVHVTDLETGRTEKLTEAPYLAFQPSAAGGHTLRFLNREGWRWTVDEVALPPPVPPPPIAAAPAPAAPPPPAPPAPVEATPFVTSDEPYSSAENLLIPFYLHGPTAAVVGRQATLLGLALAAGDPLGKHRWAGAVYYQNERGLPLVSGSLAYSNRQLAPLTLTLAASQFSVHDVPPRPPGAPDPTSADFTLYRRDRELAADVQRTFYGNPVSLGFSLIETYRPDDPAVPFALRRLAGPHLSAAYAGVESSPYTGPRRLFAASADAAAYPTSMTTTGVGFADLRGEIDVAMPLPLLRRHVLFLGGRARALVGTPYDPGFLVVGGYSDIVLWRHADRPEVLATESPLLPPGATFVESVRGFEDYPFVVDRTFIASATYRLPFIIDHGWASTLGVLPALFLSELDFELFARALTDARPGDRHAALGTSLALQFALWELSFNVQYQLTRRVTDDQALVHLVTLAL